MTLCKITGTLVATQKNEHLKPTKILIAQPIDLSGMPIGRDILAIDSVDAGVGDTVLVIQEGQGAAQFPSPLMGEGQGTTQFPSPLMGEGEGEGDGVEG